MRRIWAGSIVASVLIGAAGAMGGMVEFTLVTHPDNATWLPQPKGQVGVSGDHLVRTPDDVTASTFNPKGCFSFIFMNPVGISLPDYPPGYAEGIHSMTGSLALEVDLRQGGAVGVQGLAFAGDVALNKYSAQSLVGPGDAAADGNHGPVDGLPNSGSYGASAGAGWALELVFDWAFDAPFAGMGGIDMTFSDCRWQGFIIPVGELTPAGMAQVALEDPLGFFPGSSAEFESWLLDEVKPRLPADAAWLLFAQGTGHPDWISPGMGMTTDGLVSQTVVAYAAPEPATAALLLVAASCCIARRLGRIGRQPPPRSRS